jgi:transposase
MGNRTRRNHSPTFKAKSALAPVRGDRTLAELAEQCDVHLNQMQDWKKKLVAEAENQFGAVVSDATDHEQAAAEAAYQDWAVDDGKGFFSQCARTWPKSERKAMVKARQQFSVTRRQCQLRAMPRSSVYTRSRGVSETDVELMEKSINFISNDRSIAVAACVINCSRAGSAIGSACSTFDATDGTQGGVSQSTHESAGEGA